MGELPGRWYAICLMPDFTIPRFFVYVIESNRPVEILGQLSEGDALTRVLKFCDVPSHHRPVIDKSTLALALGDAPRLVQQFQAMPILHISAHGSEYGFELTLNQFVAWQELAAFLQPLHNRTNGSFLLALSSCRGLTAVGISFTTPQPLFGVIGTLENVPWSDNVVAYASFYHLLKKGRTISQAVEGMNVATGHNQYKFIHGPSAVSAYVEFVQPSTFTEGLG